MMKRREFFRSGAGAGLAALAGEALSSCSRKPSERAPDPSHPGYWRWVREQFSVLAGESYFNVGTLGSRPRVVTEAVVDHMRQIESTIAHYDYRPEHLEYIAGYRKQEELRGKLASLMNASAREIALLQNAT